MVTEVSALLSPSTYVARIHRCTAGFCQAHRGHPVRGRNLMLSIGQRLFGAVLLSYLTIGAVGLTLARWHFADGTRVSTSAGETEALEALKADLQSLYSSRGGWSFLPSDVAERRDWLRIEFRRLQQMQQMQQSSAASEQPLSPTLGNRLGLVDTAGTTLAGLVPSRALIAAASIDTRERTLAVDGTVIGRLVASRSDNPADELAVAFLLEQQGNLAIVAGVGLLLGAFLAAGLAGYFRRPIRQLVAGARQLESGQFAARLPAGRADELGQLAEAFNHLAARLGVNEEARAQWVADTSHELRTPLAVVRAQIEALQDGVRAATPEHLAVMLRQILALTRLVDDLAALAQPEVGGVRGEMQQLTVWPLVVDVAASFRDKAQAAGLQIDVGEAPARSAVQGDALRLRQVFGNVIENSLRYTAAGGRIEIGARTQADVLHILIADTAPGVPPNLLDRLGERFFRADPSRSRSSGGTGLGLALSRRIVQAHAGQIEFTPATLGGLCVDIALPLEK
jgi:two-component system sensor histidine kinase BaeS